MSFDLTGLVAVVTGGGRGLGRAIARGLAQHGAKLVICGRNAATLEAAAAEIGGEVLTHPADVSREDDVLALRGATLERFGTIDVLVNNAGVNPIYKGIEKTSLAEWQHIVDVNLTGAFLCCKHLGTVMAEAGRGSVVPDSSVPRPVGRPPPRPCFATQGGAALLTPGL